jgi:phosphopantothenoylcysteine decarboxylase/phosphopantothenate--cysteine ligase
MADDAQQSVLLIIGGGVAAYKSLLLIRLLRARGIAVRVILTRAGKEFVTPLSAAALSGEKIYDDLFSLTDEAEMGHIELSRSAQLVIVAPATADLMAKCANGLADDLASTALLATDKPVLMAPAMNVRMWEHPAVRRNAATLLADGVLFVGPDEGEMACGEFGLGRMAEPESILDAALTMLAGGARPLAGRRAVVTAGPTWERLDPVRYIAARSSGKQGYEIARALAALGADVTLVSGPTALNAPSYVKLVNVSSAREMLEAVGEALPADLFVGVAAVSDWRPAHEELRKRKKSAEAAPPLVLVENPDILAAVGGLKKNRPELVIGFAAETDDLMANARVKLRAKNADWIVANDVSGDVMGGADNQIVLVTRAGEETWPNLPKEEVARRLALRMAETLNAAADQQAAQ